MLLLFFCSQEYISRAKKMLRVMLLAFLNVLCLLAYFCFSLSFSLFSINFILYWIFFFVVVALVRHYRDDCSYACCVCVICFSFSINSRGNEWWWLEKTKKALYASCFFSLYRKARAKQLKMEIRKIDNIRLSMCVGVLRLLFFSFCTVNVLFVLPFPKHFYLCFASLR